MSDSKLVLVDGSSYLYRAYHALPKLTTSRGEPTGAIHGVLNMIAKLVTEEDTAHFVVVFDAPGKTFRDEMFEEYKANRPPMPDELREQIEPLLEAIPAMGLPLLRVKGVEADDVIGTLCKQAADAGMDVLVSTGDKDMAQLVNDKTTLVNTMTDSLLDRDGVKKKFDVFPEQIIDWLALVGDASDNIPGVPKVGAKTAAKWLNQYESAAGIIAKADEIGGKVGESLRDNIDQLKLSQQLATIRTDVELPEGPANLKRSAPDTDTLRTLYTRLELRRLLGQLDDNVGETDAAEKPNESRKGDYQTILTQSEFDKWLMKIDAAELVAIDTETTSINYMEAELVGISLAVEAGEAAYIPVAHDYPGAPDQLSRDAVLEAMRAFLEDPEKKKVGHHLKYDAHIFARYDIGLKGMAFDTMLESYVLNSVATRHDMDSVAGYYLNVDTIHYEDVAGKGAKQLTFNQVDLEQAAPYAAEDADITLKLHEHLWGELRKTKPLKSVYQDIEQPLVPVLLAMEEAGVLLDRDMLRKQSNELAKKMLTLEGSAHELAGGPFNLGSPKQLQEILFGQLGLPIIRKTPKGQPSTAEDVLQELADEYDLPRVILEYRSMSKLKSTYTDKLPGQVAAETGRIHTSADYSQIELRIMAHLSGDQGLVGAFLDDLDVHSATAAEVFDLETEAVTVDHRRSAKAINFGLMYGMSAFGLAKQLGISRGQAQEYVDLYFDRYPGVRKFMDDIREQALETGFVETEFGRRLYLPEINDRNAQRRQYAERSAINAPMQGTAADIIKRAMIAVQDWLTSSKAPARMIMQVHDELVLEVEEDSVDSVREELVSMMSAAADLSVPLKVDAGVGKNWDEAH